MIHAFMVKETQAKWSSRLLRKNSIENALHDYAELLDEASQAFQACFPPLIRDANNPMA